MPMLGAPELLIIMFIVMLIFGAGRLSQVGSALGSSIRDFRHAAREAEEHEKLPPPTLNEGLGDGQGPNSAAWASGARSEAGRQ